MDKFVKEETAAKREYQTNYYIKNKESIAAYNKSYRKAKKKESTKLDSKKTFPYSQYWKVSYSCLFPKGNSIKFKSVIIARSEANAKKFLFKKIKEDTPDLEVSGIRISMFDKSTLIRGKKISTLNWLDIKNSAFPNELNVLFKYNESN